MTTNSQLSAIEPKKTKANNQNGIESQKWRSHGGLSVGRERQENGGKGTENKQHKWQVENRQGEIKNSIGNGETKELICMTPGHDMN